MAHFRGRHFLVSFNIVSLKETWCRPNLHDFSYFNILKVRYNDLFWLNESTWRNSGSLIELLIVFFYFCSSGKTLLLLVKVDIVSRLLVQHFWDQDLLASFNKIHWMKSDAVFVRKCYVVFSNFNLDCVFLQVVVGNTDYSSMFWEKDLVFLKNISMKNPKSDFRQKVFRHFIWINKTKFMESHKRTFFWHSSTSPVLNIIWIPICYPWQWLVKLCRACFSLNFVAPGVAFSSNFKAQ